MFMKRRRTAFSFRCACFKCRIVFHDAHVKTAERPCPECGKEMVNVGHHFRAPRRSNVRKWKALEKYVVEHGMTFDGKDGNGLIPQSTRELNQIVNSQFRDDRYFNDVSNKTSWRARPLSPEFHSNKYPGLTRY